MTTNPNPVAILAARDQRFAQAGDTLTKQIENYLRFAKEGLPQDERMSALVRSVLGYVDPLNELTEDQSNKLCVVAETLACAIARLGVQP